RLLCLDSRAPRRIVNGGRAMSDALHIAQVDAAALYVGSLVEQAGVIYRVAHVEGFRLASVGWRAERVYFVPTHNADGDPMPTDADVYMASVHIPTQSLGQIRWWGPQRHLAARMVSA